MAYLIAAIVVGMIGLHVPYAIAVRLPDSMWDSDAGVWVILIGIIVSKIACLVTMGLLASMAIRDIV